MKEAKNQLIRTDRKGSAGFTLIEVALAIVVGLLIIAGAALAFNAAKDSQGNTKARQRVAFLGAAVEEYFSFNYRLPSQTALSTTWMRKRDDWNISPWGGGIGNDQELQSYGFITQGMTSNGIQDKLANANPDYVGGLAYFPAQGGETGSNLAAAFDVYDITKEEVTRVKTYGVASLGKDGTGFYFVQGGRDETNRATGGGATGGGGTGGGTGGGSGGGTGGGGTGLSGSVGN